MNVSASDAHLSNSTGDALWEETGAVICVNNSQIKASEFSVLPSTGPACAGTATGGNAAAILGAALGASLLQFVRIRNAHETTPTKTLRLSSDMLLLHGQASANKFDVGKLRQYYSIVVNKQELSLGKMQPLRARELSDWGFHLRPLKSIALLALVKDYRLGLWARRPRILFLHLKSQQCARKGARRSARPRRWCCGSK